MSHLSSTRRGRKFTRLVKALPSPAATPGRGPAESAWQSAVALLSLQVPVPAREVASGTCPTRERSCRLCRIRVFRSHPVRCILRATTPAGLVEPVDPKHRNHTVRRPSAGRKSGIFFCFNPLTPTIACKCRQALVLREISARLATSSCNSPVPDAPRARLERNLGITPWLLVAGEPAC